MTSLNTNVTGQVSQNNDIKILAFCADHRELGSYSHPTHTGLETSISNAIFLLGDFPYVSVELKQDDGRIKTLHLTRCEKNPGKINVHLVSDAYTVQGARYSEICERAFINVCTGEIEQGLIDNSRQGLERVLEQAADFVRKRQEMVHIVHFDTQGFHERMWRLVLGNLTDTGGQTKYCEEQAIAMARLGACCTIVNRGGPPHPENGDSRRGMHYCADMVDLMFITDSKPDDFVAKENMYPTFAFHLRDRHGEAFPLETGVIEDMARKAVMHLANRKISAVIGHYIDGAAVARRVWYLRQQYGDAEISPIPTDPVFIVHSLGELKRHKLIAGGQPLDPTLNFEGRIQTERHVLRDPRVWVMVVSNEIEESVKNHYGATPHGFYPAGVDTQVFHPRRFGVERDNHRYDGLWVGLAKARRANLGQPLPEATDQNSQPIDFDRLPVLDQKRLLQEDIDFLLKQRLVVECSRNIPSKGKDTVIRGFAEALSQSSDKNMMLVMNIADPGKLKPDDKEIEEVRKCCTHLRSLVKELGIEKNVIYRPTFAPREVARLLQVGHVYFTGAIMETWGMAVQEAAASGLPIVSTKAVPIANEALRGTKWQEQFIAGNNGSQITIGEGALLIEAGDYKAGAKGIRILLEDSQATSELRERLSEFAIERASRYDLMNLAQALLARMGFQFELQPAQDLVLIPGIFEPPTDKAPSLRLLHPSQSAGHGSPS